MTGLGEAGGCGQIGQRHGGVDAGDALQGLDPALVEAVGEAVLAEALGVAVAERRTLVMSMP
jgi:hypothetical protein